MGISVVASGVTPSNRIEGQQAGPECTCRKQSGDEPGYQHGVECNLTYTEEN